MSDLTERLTKSLIEMGLRANNVTMSSAVEDKASRKTLEASQTDVGPLMTAVEAVLNLHRPFEYGAIIPSPGDPSLSCYECHYDDGDPCYWPCPTVQAITESPQGHPVRATSATIAALIIAAAWAALALARGLDALLGRITK